MNLNYLKKRIRAVSSNNYYVENTQDYISLYGVYATKIMLISELPSNMELTINKTGRYLSGTLLHENLGIVCNVYVVYDGTVPYTYKKCLVLFSDHY